jgi:hypothetical protein
VLASKPWLAHSDVAAMTHDLRPIAPIDLAVARIRATIARALGRTVGA